MALTLLSGTSANIDISLAGASVKCSFGMWSATFVRSATRTTTFCSGGWVEEQPGDKQLLFRLDGYAGKGVAHTDPSIYVTASSTTAVILTADTGCTLTFAGNVFEDGVQLVAAANSGRSISGRSSGSVTTAWTVA